ncbi:FAD-binding oxidoreductase [Rhodococcus sp. (in: high G+C Gram-positive bacteria)]|uniref:NAD(P)/FAD-dependent oxidoreductase n=1 Tax=Rhodococcus sp. TaxID=1831 RepID=UPI001A2C0B3B|nr:FAD-binding oxidoreductase [Rhodococcus sp. (in: high G+C Gram-positive bacteria)]MBJ7476874.1 FAD-binding oxidoreductase [Rhodococcus sp. (in: high G+C Gram-positive bacteria)]
MTQPNGRNDSPILVIGAGVVGASIAYHLARVGLRVTVLEHGSVAGGVTGNSFAWVGLSKSAAETYSDPFRQGAAVEFDRLERELVEPIGLRRRGAITWEETEAETRAFVDAHRALGHPVDLIGKEEILAREPGLRRAPVVAASAPDDGGVDPVAFARSLLRGAEEYGATVHSGVSALGVLTEGARVCGVVTADGPVYGSTTVLAAGTAIPGLAASAGVDVEVDASPCCLIRFSTPRTLVNGILSTPDFEIRQLDDTTLIAAEDVPVGFSGDARELAEPTLQAVRSPLVDGDHVELIEAVVADRPIPRGGRPLLGFAEGVSGLYLAAAHPAIILAGAIGAHVAGDFARASSLDC